MVIVRTTEGQKYHIPTNNESEAIRLVKAQGIPENHIFTVEVFHEVID
jgi:hypothetical protein